MNHSSIACEGSGEPALFDTSIYASNNPLRPKRPMPASTSGLKADCSWCKISVSVNLDGKLARHYPPIEYDLLTKGTSMTTQVASPSSTRTENGLFYASEQAWKTAAEAGIDIDMPPSLEKWPVGSFDDPSKPFQCDKKRGYLDLDIAIKASDRLSRAQDKYLRIYACPFGLHWHITSQIRRNVPIVRAPSHAGRNPAVINAAVPNTAASNPAGYHPIRPLQQSSERVEAEASILPGELWGSTRHKHFGMTVEVVRVTPNSVNIRVVSAGANQNNRRIVGKREHIGLSVFKSHYKKMQEAPTTLAKIDKVQEKPIIQMPAAVAEPKTPVTLNEAIKQYDYDFKVDELVERTVAALKRWGPVKAYVITQYISKNLNAARTNLLIDRGVKLGLLESWEVPVNAARPSVKVRMVGLPGAGRTPIRPDGGHPHMVQPTVKINVLPNSVTEIKEEQSVVNTTTTEAKVKTARSQADIARATMDRQYDALTKQQREEIGELAKPGGSTTQEIQKAYHILGGVVGRIKREHGLATKRNEPKRAYKPRAKRVPAVTAAEAQDMRSGLDLATPTTTSVQPKAAQQFIVTVMVMQPTQVTVTVNANSFGAAEAAALATSGAVEVLSVSKAN